MTKSFCTLLAFALCAFSFSTASSAQSIRFGLKAGVGAAKFDYEPTPPADSLNFDYHAGMWYARENKFRTTFLVGGVLEYDLSKDFLLSSGAQVCVKFSHVDADEHLSTKNDFRMHLLYLQIPMNVHYRTGKFFLGGGGYAGFGIGGKWKNEYYDDKELKATTSDRVKFGGNIETSNLKRFDAGLRAEVGFGLKTIRLSIAYDHGLVNNLASGTGNNYYGFPQFFDSKLRHQAITATATYYWLAK